MDKEVTPRVFGNSRPESLPRRNTSVSMTEQVTSNFSLAPWECGAEELTGMRGSGPGVGGWIEVDAQEACLPTPWDLNSLK